MLIVCDQPVSTEASLQTSRCQKVLSHARCIHPPLTIDTDAGLVCFFFFTAGPSAGGGGGLVSLSLFDLFTVMAG